MTLPTFLPDDVWIAESSRIVWVSYGLFRSYSTSRHNSIPIVLKILSPLHYYCDDLNRRADLLDWVDSCPVDSLP
jgi:hypothetical protein